MAQKTDKRAQEEQAPETLTKRPQDKLQDKLAEELEESFPASDPPSITQPAVKPGAPDHKKAGRT